MRHAQGGGLTAEGRPTCGFVACVKLEYYARGGLDEGAARLGHADPSITLRVYAHVISDQLTEAADIFAQAVATTN
jgi:integrase